MLLYIHCRQWDNVGIAKNKARPVKMYFFSIFLITTFMNLLSGSSNASTLVSLLAINTKYCGGKGQ
jgi:hypothetical protein